MRLVTDRNFPVPVLGIPIQALTELMLVDLLTRSALEAREKPLFITYLNAACSNLAARDEDYKAILLHADCVYADGKSVVWAARVLGHHLPERVNAGDLIDDACRQFAERSIRITLIGGRPGVAERTADIWRKNHVGLQVLDHWDGYPSDGGETAIRALNERPTDILMVGMGAPLQEKWVMKNLGRLNCKVIWCVGALFEYYGESRVRAPVWMRKAGLEWAFRLILEPRRLWRRYLIGNLVFVYRVLKALFRK